MLSSNIEVTGKSILAWMEDDIYKWDFSTLKVSLLTVNHVHTLESSRTRLLPPVFSRSSKFRGFFLFFFCQVIKHWIRGSAFVSEMFSVPGRDYWVEHFCELLQETQPNRKPFRFPPAGTSQLSPLTPFLCLGDQTFWHIALPPRNSGNLMDNMTSCLLTS